jgi:hypothetical protein
MILALLLLQDVDDLIRTLQRKPAFADAELRIVDRAYLVSDAGRALRELERKTGLAAGVRAFQFRKTGLGTVGIPFQETLGWSPSGWAGWRTVRWTREQVRAE